MDGYYKLATFMGTYRGLAIYRRFATLGAQILVYMQAELVHLEDELADIAGEDKCSPDGVKKLYEYSWLAMKESSTKSGDNLQWQKIQEIQSKLHIYCMRQSHTAQTYIEAAHRSSLLQTPPFCSTPRCKAWPHQTTLTLESFEIG
jgi:hypothetical protein